MSCVEKRHVSHRVGSMLHHRFPNGFTDLFMDETDREVSTLTDRAFRSLCVGDDAVYNDEFLYGFSPFSCHKPLVGEPLKKAHHKESKKQAQNKNEKSGAQPWKQQQNKNLSQMSSFLKALSATEESCEGLLIKNGGTVDTNGESWDKSALRSIQKELYEFSSYHTNLTGEHCKSHHLQQSGDGSSKKTGKNIGLPSGKSSKIKNGKSVKLRKLNVTNFFLHSEFSPFQAWKDFNRFPFGKQETSVLQIENIPKWYDLPFYKELTEAHRKDTHIEEMPSCQKTAIEPPPPTAPKPVPPPPPPKTVPKSSASLAEKRCASGGVDGSAAPWRRNRSRAKSAIQVNKLGIPSQDNYTETVDETVLLVNKDSRSVVVKAVEEVSSLASTPFSICQLMTPLIPSRQPTDTSEILLSSALDLPLRPHSEAKVITEPPVQRDSYKSLASSILFNLKDNRKRVKSHYNSRKFKTSELPEGGSQSPQSDYLKNTHTGSDGNASGISIPAILKDEQTFYSPILEPASTPAAGLLKNDPDRPLSDDYLLSSLLQTKREAAGSAGFGEENPIFPLIHSKKNKSPMAKKQNYPSLNLYKKTSPVDNDIKYLQVPQSKRAPEHIVQPAETNGLSPLMLSKDLSPKALPTNTGLSPNTLNVNRDHPSMISPHALEHEKLSSTTPVGKRTPNVPEKSKQLVKDKKDKEPGAQPTCKEKENTSQKMITKDVIRAAREAINVVKSKALSATQSETINKPNSDTEELKVKETDKAACSNEMFSSKRQSNSNVKKEPPPVPKRAFAKPDINHALDQQPTHNLQSPNKCDLENAKLEISPEENDSVLKQGKLKHVFSAKQNNYIKHQRYAVEDDELVEDCVEGDLNVNTRKEMDEVIMSLREMGDSENLINDLQDLKELERARLGDHVVENKLGVMNIEEQARAKNDLISKELRNIKKGMLSMRGNTLAKKELFTKKEQRKQEGFAKLDSNVMVNKALLNDNYDKAKMALEEIIAERQKRKNALPENNANLVFEENTTDERYVTRVQKGEQAVTNSLTKGKEKTNENTFVLKDTDLKERLDDLRDHSYMRQILAQTELRFGESHRCDGRMALPGMNKIDKELNAVLQAKAKHVQDRLTTTPSCESEEVNLRHVARQVSDESGENLGCDTKGKRLDAPPVPPRNKKGSSRRDGSITKETDRLQASLDEDVADKDEDYENGEECLKEPIGIDSVKQDIDLDLSTKVPGQSEATFGKDTRDVINNANLKPIAATSTFTCESILPSQLQSENTSYLSPKFRDEKEANKLKTRMNSQREATAESSNSKAQESCKLKGKSPLRPDFLNTPGNNITKDLVAEDQTDKINRPSKEVNVDADAVGEIPTNITSPLLLSESANHCVSGENANQSPPDQASLSSKSSYFSAESALHRNTETESNVYHSLDNLIGEAEEVIEGMRNATRNMKQESDRTEVDYYSLSDHESEPEIVKRSIASRQMEGEAPYTEGKESENIAPEQSLSQNESNKMPMSPSNTFSLTLGIPSLFKVKDNTFSNKSRKTAQPWSRRASLSGLEREEEVLHQVMENPVLPLVDETTTSSGTIDSAEILKPKESLSNQPHPLLLSPSSQHNENPKKAQAGQFLTVPQEDDRFSEVSPSSEGLDSLTTSTADTADEMGTKAGVLAEPEALKVPSERSGSTCSGNDSQTGLPKPPAVLPKSEKAVLKAIKLTNRRMKKEEAQKSSHRSSQNSGKPKADRHKGDKSDNKSSTTSRNGRSGEKKHREKTEDNHERSEINKDANEQLLCERGGIKDEYLECDRAGMTQRNCRKNQKSKNQSAQAPPSIVAERQGRSSDRNSHKLGQRHYSCDRVISNVPVYKARLGERPMSDRPFNRSRSTDRYVGDKTELKLSAKVSVNEKLDPAIQNFEAAITDEPQQGGGAGDKASTENPLRRSHSIDAYTTEMVRPTPVSRQSSLVSQFSRQSSIEHAIVTQSFPMTQRKLLQDPDSGQYFFVDMPVQVKTKTFFDPETGSYVQLPVQPTEGAIPQASPMEVLTPPLVLYHGFVPVPLSPLAQKATIQTPHMEPEEFEQRCLERSRQTHFQEGHAYLEPIYSQHEHMLGEFLGIEELDCPS